MILSHLSPADWALLVLGLWGGGLWAFTRRNWPLKAGGGVLLLGAAWLSLFLIGSLALELAARSNQRQASTSPHGGPGAPAPTR